jgi:hypothetical protein
MTMQRRVLGAIALVVTAVSANAIPLAAQSSGTPPELPERLRADTRATISRLADSLRSADIPWEPLYAKSAEGVLKGADDARILRAVHSLARELAAARQALGRAASTAEIVAGASALHAGVPAEDLRRLARMRPSRAGESPLAVPITVLADLVTRRVPPSVAMASISALLQRGAPDERFTTLRTDVERDILSGQAPAAAARARTLIQSSGPPE